MVKHTQTIRGQPTNCLSVFKHLSTYNKAPKHAIFLMFSPPIYHNNSLRFL